MWPAIAGGARAQDDGEAASAATTPAAPPGTAEARRHFKAGTKLYRDGNYGGALAEFEEAYRLKPGVGSLQNVALSQKGLFRYAEAAASLEQLLSRHSSELSEGERKAVEAALSELSSLVASIKLSVKPKDARVLLNGQRLSADELAQSRVLNVGEHSLSVEAPGYAPVRRALRLAGGQRDVPIDVALRCVAGFIDVTSNHPSAYIAIDGLPKARGAYQGPVQPDTDHLLQIYGDGFEPFEQTLRVGMCKTVEVRAKLVRSEGARGSDGPDALTPPGASPPGRAQRGFYGLISIDLLGLSRQPLNLDISKAKSGGGVAALGLRAGYRLSSPIAFDLLLAAGELEVLGATDKSVTPNVTHDYALRSIHLGPNLKLMTTGESVRFVTGVGAGMVHHRLAISGGVAEEVRGVDPYFLLELALGFNFGRFLGEIGLVALIDGTTTLQRGFSAEANRRLTRDLGTTLPMVGLGLRGGFSQWRPAR